MSATVDVITETRNDIIKIPIQALTARRYEDLPMSVVSNDQEGEGSEQQETSEEYDEYVEVVFVILEDNTVELRRVESGISGTTYIEILSGLEEDEKVVTGPFRLLSRTLKDGDGVKVVETLLGEENTGRE